MKPVYSMSSCCRNCRYYEPEGRRGGYCQQFNAPVQSNWKSCPLATPAFAPSWKALQTPIVWQRETLDAEPTEMPASKTAIAVPQTV